MVFFEKALFVLKFKMKMLLDEFSNYLTEASQVYNKFSRCILPKQLFYSSFEYVKNSKIYRYQGPLTWNALDADLKTCKTLQSFKAKLKNLLLQKYGQET